MMAAVEGPTTYLSNNPLEAYTSNAVDYNHYAGSTELMKLPLTNGHSEKAQTLEDGYVNKDKTDSVTTDQPEEPKTLHDESPNTRGMEQALQIRASQIVAASTDAGDPPTIRHPTTTAKQVISAKQFLVGSHDAVSHLRSPVPKIMNLAPTVLPGATKLKRRLEETNELIVCPGVHDGFSARIAMSVGFDALYMTGAGTTASRLGMADLGVAQLHDMREHAEMIANLDPQGPPLIADMDTGYGGPIMVAKAVQQYIRANVAGFHIEDQIQNKRCGHLAGKQVVDLATFLSRMRAAKAAKDELQSDIVLIARTDANQQHGYDECITRLRAARDIGADVGLLEGFKSKAEARHAVLDLAPWPLLLNSVENGSSPLITVDEAREMGFRIMIFSFATLAPMYEALRGNLEALKNEGKVRTRKELTPKKLFEVCGLQDSVKLDVLAGGTTFKEGI
ncbi:MAG: hypothetical protein Q9181_007479 [Wetmoreana brouardii]